MKNFISHNCGSWEIQYQGKVMSTVIQELPLCLSLSVCLSVPVGWNTLALLHVASHSLLGQLGQGCPSGARILKESTCLRDLESYTLDLSFLPCSVILNKLHA